MHDAAAAAASIDEVEKGISKELTALPGLSIQEYVNCFVLCAIHRKDLEKSGAAVKLARNGLRSQLDEILRRKGDSKQATHISGVLNAFILAELAEDRDNPALEQIIELTLTSGNEYLRSVGQLLPAKTMKATVSAAFHSERGKSVALDAALFRYRTLEFQERIGALLAWQYIRTQFFAMTWDDDRDQILWDFAQRLSHASVVDGKIGAPQFIQASAAWKGVTGFFGWSGLQPALPAEMRPGAGYIYAHRLLQLKQKADAIAVLTEVVKVAPTDSPVHRLATEKLAELNE
ncbi:MAG: hypothetical protein QM811_17885 [Pirellulales bacterium]